MPRVGHWGDGTDMRYSHPEVVPPVNGIDMGTGASIGFFGPTNKENAVGGKQSNFSTSEPVEGPKFEPKKPKKRKVVSNSDAKNDPTPPATRDDSHPSDTCWKQPPPFLKQDQKISLIPNSLLRSWIGQ